jgi:hypothetical protein
MKKQSGRNPVKLIFIAVTMFFADSICENSVAGFEFINLPVSARVAGGTVSLIGSNNNVLAVRTNPAMLAGIKKNAVEIDFAPVIMDIYSGAISSVILHKTGIVIVPTISYLSFGTLDAVDENGNDLQTEIAPFAVSIETAAAYKFYEKLSVGVRLKFLHEQLTKKSIYWEGNSAGSIVADLGMFSDYGILRYCAGFKNLGFVLSGYSDCDVKLPASAFAAIGVIIETEARIEWYLECEKYFYDYMFFRTGFELPVYRDVLILRTGTAFSPNDVKAAFGNFAANTKESWEYSSQTWLLCSVGATINAKIDKNLLSLDIACQFRKDGIKPGFLFSGTMYF